MVAPGQIDVEKNRTSDEEYRYDRAEHRMAIVRIRCHGDHDPDIDLRMDNAAFCPFSVSLDTNITYPNGHQQYDRRCSQEQISSRMLAVSIKMDFDEKVFDFVKNRRGIVGRI